MSRELLLLGVLREREMHGYELVEFIDHNIGRWLDLKRPTTYFLLEKMAEAGWITAEEHQEGRRPVRRVYRLTSEGEMAFQHLLRENLASYSPHNFPDDVGLAFLDTLPPAETAILLRERRKTILRLRDELALVPAHPGSTQWVFEHHLRHLEAELNWVDEVILRIEKQTDTSV
jgi:DNA-binding PadR family transcriptional regulator